MRWSGPEITDDVLFQVAEKIAAGKKATQVSEEMKALNISIGREQVYNLLAKAVDRGFLRLCAPLEHTVTSRLAERYPQTHFRVANVSTKNTAVERVAATGAELVLSLIKQCARAGKDQVHVGFASGNTLRMLARELSVLMRAETTLPNLVLQALSSGLSVEHPTRAPLAFFSFFDALPIDVRCIGLFSPAMVEWREYEKTKKLHGIRETFDQKKGIDIVVMSMASASDPHGLFNHFMALGKQTAVDKLNKAGWVGDVHWRPFSEHGPINVNTGVRSMTLFEIDELREWANRPDKHIVLMAAPCGQCSRTKSDAIKPLLREPVLHCFNHLVTDVRTAGELL